MKFETQIIAVIPRTNNATSFRLQKPSNLSYLSGQYMIATLIVNSKEIMHPLSFSSSPTDKDFIEFTKKFTDSDYSNALKALTIGDKVKIEAPFGQFTFTGEYPKICLIAGGIGITPFWSICKYCTDTKLSCSIVLLYVCRSENEIAFFKELVETQTKNPNLKVVFVLSQPSGDWKGQSGIINADLITKEVADYLERVFYVCGPPGMMATIKQVVASLGVSNTQLKFEVLTGHN